MRWKSHKVIASKISNNLGFSSKNKREFREASILPDEWENYPHHKEKDAEIRKRIIEARKKRIRDENYARPLGIACHYIADKYSLPSKHKKHDEFERKIASEAIKEESFPKVRGQKETIGAGMGSPDLYREFPYKIKMSPSDALNEAYKKCYQVAESVTSDTSPPEEFKDSFEDSLRKWLDRINLFRFSWFSGMVSLAFLSFAGKEGVVGAGVLILLNLLLAPLFPSQGKGAVGCVLHLAKYREYPLFPVILDGFIGLLLLIQSSLYSIPVLYSSLSQFINYSMLKSCVDQHIFDNQDWYNWDVLEDNNTLALILYRHGKGLEKAKPISNSLPSQLI